MPGFSTRAIKAAGRVPDAPQPPVNVPIYATSTFEVSDAAELGDLLEFGRPGHSYTRYSNPTHEALEGALAELEGAEMALSTASGMAAIHAVILSILQSGDELLMPCAVYGGTLGLAHAVLARSGIGHRMVDTTDSDAVVAAMTPRTKLLWLETITNPTTAMADVATLAKLAHDRGVVVAVDNTFASPALANPLAWGADIVVHSTTKYVGGHSDLMGGAIIGPSERVTRRSSRRSRRRSRPRPLTSGNASRRRRVATRARCTASTSPASTRDHVRDSTLNANPGPSAAFDIEFFVVGCRS